MTGAAAAAAQARWMDGATTTGGGTMDRAFEYRPGLFFTASYLATWIPWVAAVYLATRPGGPGSAMAFAYLGLLGPLVVTLIIIYRSGSRTLKADFRNRFGFRRLRPLPVLLAIAVPAAAMYLAIGMSVLWGQSPDQFRASADADLGRMIALAMIAAPIIEEISWRGYGVDSLRARLGMLSATLVFGVLWSLWHIPLLFLPGTYQHEVASTGSPLFVANFFVGGLPMAIIANWLYYRSERSILIGVVFHAAGNASAELLSATQVTKCIVTLLMAVVAIGLIVVDRKVFGAGPRTFVLDPADASQAVGNQRLGEAT
jgi:membrane protease YdiL (CAAX protease family)